ncbi:isocitrate lyase [Methylocella sp. CPCC 101449]|jgi:isocitrate lyase|uniref:isocitrate lyase n=1 Tax=Methylocella sp. CPCC 101449 TaxID=2987531 RepID=UPI0028913784|nr:isocitrate lyase [Methylocella sp. CPCC 101449]MDT2021886.1 isocitrate lyase [Methylocella sp. CPCC 101449]HEV2571975.1 isocitrate lyase [Beijerinckiaceae bacterium]
MSSFYNPENRRDYTAAEVDRLSGSIRIEHTLAKLGAARLRKLLAERPFVRSLGAMTGGQALQQVKGGLEAIYLSGWQVAADANNAGQMYPDQSLYPASSVPEVVKRINNTLQRADQIARAEGDTSTYWFAPIVADAEAGFGGPLNAFELMKSMIEAGAAGVHFEDQLASEKKCGHLGGKVLVPTQTFIRTLNAARLAADVCGVDTIICARTDAHSATLITSDIDDYDHPFIDRSSRTGEGFYRLKQGNHHSVEHAIARGLAYAPYSDLVWWETSEPDLGEAREFAQEMHRQHPGRLLAYNCSPSFNWRSKLDAKTIESFQEQIAEMGYRFQFVTLAGFHALNLSMFDLAKGYAKRGMGAYSEMQEREFAAQANGFTAVRHQREVGTGYFDAVAMAISGGKSSTTAMAGSTETAQFHKSEPRVAAE